MKLRPMTMADADKLLEFKNYDETRMFAIATQEEIKKEDHYKWLQENIDHFQIMYDKECDVCGAVRIQDQEISVWVDRGFWKRGIATYILQHVSKRGMTAKIVSANIASMRAFIRAGFEPKSFQDGYYIYQKF